MEAQTLSWTGDESLNNTPPGHRYARCLMGHHGLDPLPRKQARRSGRVHPCQPGSSTSILKLESIWATFTWPRTSPPKLSATTAWPQLRSSLRRHGRPHQSRLSADLSTQKHSISKAKAAAGKEETFDRVKICRNYVPSPAGPVMPVSAAPLSTVFCSLPTASSASSQAAEPSLTAERQRYAQQSCQPFFPGYRRAPGAHRLPELPR